LYGTLKTKVNRCWSLSQPNKCVFNARRNWWRVRSDCRRLDGRLFHSRGPATGNARSPRRVLVRGTTNVAMSDARSWGWAL